MTDEEFGKELITYAEIEHRKIFDNLTDKGVQLLSYEVKLPLSKEFFEKYSLDKIQVVLKASCFAPNQQESKLEYYYDEYLVKPDCYYIRPDNYNKVSTLEMLQEAVRQGTNKPDIKPLENKNNKEQNK